MGRLVLKMISLGPILIQSVSTALFLSLERKRDPQPSPQFEMNLTTDIVTSHISFFYFSNITTFIFQPTSVLIFNHEGIEGLVTSLLNSKRIKIYTFPVLMIRTNVIVHI